MDSDNDAVIVDVLDIFIQQKPFSTVSSNERYAKITIMILGMS